MDDREAKLECLKLAVAVFPRGVDDPADAVAKIASRFYNHITEEDLPSGTSKSLTAQVDKRAKASPTK